MYKISLFQNNGLNLILYCKHIIHETTSQLHFKGIIEDISFVEINDSKFDECLIEVLNNEQNFSVVMGLDISFCRASGDGILIDAFNYISLENDFENSIFKYIEIFQRGMYREWIKYNEKQKFNWLRSSLKYNSNPLNIKKNITIEGSYITSKHSFLCEFSEQIIGVGGYFGSDLDGFNDCFGCFYPNYTYLKLLWKDFHLHAFDKKDIILDILRSEENNIELSIC